jgi:hypothetical protein
MKNILTFVGTLGLLLIAGSASAATITFKATLTGTQQDPPVGTSATGTAEITLDDVAKTISGTITYTGLSGPPNAAHIHEAACGHNGPPVFDFDEVTADKIEFEDGELEDAEIADLKAGNYYINVHTAANPNGEIRGQLFEEGSQEKCPSGGPTSHSDAGTSGGADGGSSSSSSGSASGSSSGSSAATTTDDGGCSTTGSAPAGGGLALGLGVAWGLAAMMRNRRKR